MCMSCGCMQPNNDHGDQRNITQTDLEQAARAANISPEQAAQNIMSCCGQMGAGQGAQSQSSAGSSASASSA